MLQLGNAGATGSISGALIDNSILAVNHANTLTLANAISGTGQLLQVEARGVTILSADNTYTGNTTISAGILQLGNGNATGSVVGVISDKRHPRHQPLQQHHLFKLCLGHRPALQHLGDGTTTITADNTFTGVTTIAAGVLQLGNGSTSGSSSSVASATTAPSPSTMPIR